jgi:serine/threonine-protein kinase
MNFKIPVAGLLIGLLVACSETKHDPTVPSTPKQQQVRQSKPEINQPSETGAKKLTNPFDRASFPKDSCGDKLPNDPKTDTVNFYPVFIDYTESNLQTVKTNYCRDARKITRKAKGKEAIQVASFISKEHANKFKEILGNKLGSVSLEVGEPTVISVNPTGDVEPEGEEANNLANISSSANSIGRAAKLTPEQVKQLININKQVKQGENKMFFVLPTYLPSGFEVSSFKVDYFHAYSISGTNRQALPSSSGPVYEIIYRNPRNSCFIIHGFPEDRSGDGPGQYDIVKEIDSPAFGKVSLGYTEFDRRSGHGLLRFELNKVRINHNEYIFESPATDQNINPICTNISLQEGVKIVKSFQFLNR